VRDSIYTQRPESAQRELLYWSLRRKGISKKLVTVIRSMYDGAVTKVRSGRGKTLAFEIKVGVH